MTDDLDIDEPDQDEQPDEDVLAPVAPNTRDTPLRYSVLKLMGKSAAHARDAALRESDGPSLALRLGAGCHALTFEDKRVTIYEGKQRRGKDWEAFKKAHPDDVILSKSELAKAKGMADSIRSHPIASRVLFESGVNREQRIDWEWNGRKWRSTPDAFKFRTLSELKTTRCADPAVFWRDALRMSYHVQLALYRRAIEKTTGVRPRDVYLFAVESVRPYVVTPFMLSERSLEHGNMLAERWHEAFLRCEESGEWPGYTTEIAELDIYDPGDESQLEVERVMAEDDGTRANVAF